MGREDVIKFLFNSDKTPSGCDHLVDLYMDCIKLKNKNKQRGWADDESQILQIINSITKLIPKYNNHAGMKIHLCLAAENLFTVIMALVEENNRKLAFGKRKKSKSKKKKSKKKIKY
jgi:hypothetical protein